MKPGAVPRQLSQMLQCKPPLGKSRSTEACERACLGKHDGLAPVLRHGRDLWRGELVEEFEVCLVSRHTSRVHALTLYRGTFASGASFTFAPGQCGARHASLDLECGVVVSCWLPG